MCDPLTLGSLAVGAAGAGINGYEANQNAKSVSNARNAATMAELERDKVYGEKSRGAFDNSLGVFTPANQTAGLTSAQGSIGDTLNRNTNRDVGRISSGNAPAVVGASEEARLGDVFTKAGQSNARLGALKGYDQNQFNNKVALNDNARTIDMYGDFARTSAGVNQIEQRAAAQNAQRPPSGLGDLLTFAGSVGANQGGRGATLGSYKAPLAQLPAFY